MHLYDHLFNIENPSVNDDDFIQSLNSDSLTILNDCKLEPCLKNAALGKGYQFMRIGYFCLDLDSTPNNLVFNRATGLRDRWSKKK